MQFTSTIAAIAYWYECFNGFTNNHGLTEYLKYQAGPQDGIQTTSICLQDL